MLTSRAQAHLVLERKRVDECQPRRVCSFRAGSSKNVVLSSPDTARHWSESVVFVHASNHNHASHLHRSNSDPSRLPLHSKATKRSAVHRMGLRPLASSNGGKTRWLCHVFSYLRHLPFLFDSHSTGDIFFSPGLPQYILGTEYL